MIHTAASLTALALLASVYAWGLLCGLACGVLGARAVLRWVEP